MEYHKMPWNLRFEDRPGQSLCIVEKGDQVLGAFRCNREEFDDFKSCFDEGVKSLTLKGAEFLWPNQMKQKL